MSGSGDTRPLEGIFGTMKDGSEIPMPFIESKLQLAGAIYSLLYQASENGDSVVQLSVLHACSLLVAELNERLERHKLWVPPLPPPLGGLKR